MFIAKIVGMNELGLKGDDSSHAELFVVAVSMARHCSRFFQLDCVRHRRNCGIVEMLWLRLLVSNGKRHEISKIKGRSDYCTASTRRLRLTWDESRVEVNLNTSY